MEVKRQQTLKGIDKLREELAQQQERVRAVQEKIERLRKELGVPVIGTAKLTDLTLQQLEQKLTDARLDAVGRETRLKELQKLTPKQLRNAIATIINDPTVQQLLQNYTDTETRLEVLKEDYGPDHPNVRGAIASRDKLLEQLDARLEGIMRGFEVEYQMAQVRVTEIQKQLDDAKNSSLVLEGERYLPFRNALREEELETKLYEALKSRMQQESIELELPRSPVELIDRAQPSLVAFKPNMAMNITLGAIIGLMLGVGLTFFIEFLDTSIKKMEDVERYLGLPVLGVVPQQACLLSREEASPAHLEAYRMLRTNIEFSKRDGAVKSMSVVSAGAGEGKSFTTANLAFVYSQHGARVLIVDSDMRRPSVHQYLGVSNAAGLADFLDGSKTVEEIVQPTNMPNVWMITAGGSRKAISALPLLTSQRMEELVQELGQQFDLVLYDTPPVLAVSDAAVVAREVGLAVLVIQHRRYPRAMSLRARQVVENSGGRVLGVVVNNVNVGQDESYYYYHDHYNYYQRGPEAAPSALAAPVAVAAEKPKSDEFDLPGKY